MRFRESLAKNLAAAFLAGKWSREGLVRRGGEALGSNGRWLRPLVERVMRVFGQQSPGVQPEMLTRFILKDRGFWQACATRRLALRRIYWPVPTMAPAPGSAANWSIPPITTTAQLAEWLETTPQKLDWYRGKFQRDNKGTTFYARYQYHWLKKRSGSYRLLETPIHSLKSVQRRVLREILNHIPPHEAVHSFTPGRSLLGFVQPHVSKHVVIRMDLEEFFPSIHASRVQALFRTLGYPKEIVLALAGLCTSIAPEYLFELDALPKERFDFLPASGVRQLRNLYRSPHLPQGAPTSPMLSNLCAFRLDVRLFTLAQSIGADYTRYADDLAFSGGPDLERCFRRLHVAIGTIVLEEGFRLNTRKTRLMHQGNCQRLAGVVLNAHPNMARRHYDQLKAVIYNCLRHGPASQNRGGVEFFREHLCGRVQWLMTVNPDKGKRLFEMLQQIDWSEPREDEAAGE